MRSRRGPSRPPVALALALAVDERKVPAALDDAEPLEAEAEVAVAVVRRRVARTRRCWRTTATTPATSKT